MKNLLAKLSYITIGLALFLTFYFGYLLFWPVNIIDINGDYQVTNPNKQVKMGENLYYIIDYNKYLPLPATITTTLQNDFVIGMSTRSSDIPIGHHIITSFTALPSCGLIHGKARLVFTYSYQVNKFRYVLVKGQTEEFEIIK